MVSDSKEYRNPLEPASALSQGFGKVLPKQLAAGEFPQIYKICKKVRLARPRLRPARSMDLKVALGAAPIG